MSLSAIRGNYSNFFPLSLLSKVQEPKPNCDMPPPGTTRPPGRLRTSALNTFLGTPSWRVERHEMTEIKTGEKAENNHSGT